jgi:protein YibB
MNDEISIVTNFFDIGRGNLPTSVRGFVLPHFQHRSTEKYFEYFEELSKLKNHMVVYTTEEFADRIYNTRKKHGLEDNTSIVVLDSFMPKEFEPLKERVKSVLNDVNFYNKVDKPHFVEYWWPEYIMIQFLKIFYINHAISNKLVTSDLTAWIDFGYCRNTTSLPPDNHWKYNFDKNKIHLFSLRPIEPQRPIDDIIYRGDVYIMGCHMIGGNEKWIEFQKLVDSSMDLLLKNNLVHYDQTLYLMSYLSRPDLFEIRYVNGSDWFVVLKDYND